MSALDTLNSLLNSVSNSAGAMGLGGSGADLNQLLGLINQANTASIQGLSFTPGSNLQQPSLARDDFFGLATPVQGGPYNQGTGLGLAAQEQLGSILGLPTLNALKQQADIQGTYNPVVNYQWISTTHGPAPTGTYSNTTTPPTRGPGGGTSGQGNDNIADGYWAPVYSDKANATEQNQKDFASLFGQAGSFGNNAAGATGNNGQQLYTTTEQDMLTKLIQNAAGGNADPFTQLAKNQTLMNSGFIGNILKSYIQSATGQSMAGLQAQPNVSNVQLAGDLANAATGGQASPATSTFLNTIFGQNSNPAGNPAAGGNNTTSAGGSSTNGSTQLDPLSQAIDRLWQSSPNNPITGKNPGWMTPMQGWSQLSPSVQAAYTDLAQYGPNGQSPTDFLNQLKQGAPEFASSGNAKLGSVAGM